MNNAKQRRDSVLKDALQIRAQLVSHAWAMLGNHAEAEDAVQETFLVVAEKYHQFKDDTSILAWCRSILRLEILRARQRRKRDLNLVDRLLNEAVDAAFEEFQVESSIGDFLKLKNALSTCIQKLSDRQKAILSLRFKDNCSYQMICERMGIKLEAVRKTLFRTKKQLRTCVSPLTEGLG